MPVPYEARNAADFEAMTRRIGKALDQIETNPTLSATEKTLTQLARCSRQTLHNRAWPIARLKAIKARRQRAATAQTPTRPESAEDRRRKERHDLLDELKEADRQIAEAIEMYFRAAREIRSLQHRLKVLSESKEGLEVENTALKEEKARLVAEKAELAKALLAMPNEGSQDPAPPKVIPIRLGSKPRKEAYGRRTDP